MQYIPFIAIMVLVGYVFGAIFTRNRWGALVPGISGVILAVVILLSLTK